MPRTRKSNIQMVRDLLDFAKNPGPPIEDKKIIVAAEKGEFVPLLSKLSKLPSSALSTPLKALLMLVIEKEWPTPAKAKHRPKKEEYESMAMALHFFGRLAENPNRKAALQDTAAHFKCHLRTVERAIRRIPTDKK